MVTYKKKYRNKKLIRNKFKNVTQKRRFKKLKCAPNRNKFIDKNLQKLSCYSNTELFKFKEIWNSRNKNNLIKTNNPKDIWYFFKTNLNNKCYDELCWLNEQKFDSNINKTEIVKNIFRPFSPKSWKEKPYEWLSSVDILNVMRQYEKTYKNFVFIGPSPIDFDAKKLFGTCVWEQLCKFDLSKYYNSNPQKNKIGIIFNTDPHTKNGSHWIALFIDLQKKFIFYFDSNGDKIPKRIDILVKRIIEQAGQLNLKVDFYSNEGKEHQKKDGQCGMYTLFFIIELLKGTKEASFFKNERIPDEMMRDYRIKYYNTE